MSSIYYWNILRLGYDIIGKEQLLNILKLEYNSENIEYEIILNNILNNNRYTPEHSIYMDNIIGRIREIIKLY
jgi:hypothetical protein